MKKNIMFIWACLICIVVSNGFVASTSVQAASKTFSDIPDGHWAKSAIYQMSEKGAVSGFPDGTFRPDGVITADQFITMMIMAHSEIYPNGKRDWQTSWWNALDYGTQSFMVNLGFDFHLSKTGYWAQPFINQAVSMGFLKLSDGVFNGNFKVLLTRENASFLLAIWLNTYEPRESNGYLMLAKSGVKDYFASSKIGQSTILTCLIKGVMRGYPDQTFRPNRFVTRAEAIKMVQSLSDKTIRNPYKPDLTGTFHTSLTWKDGSPRIVVFQTKEFLDATVVLEKAGSQTKGVSYGNKMGQGFFANQIDLDLFENPNFEIDWGLIDTNTAEMGISIGDGDNNYELTVHFNNTFQSTHKEAYDSFSQYLFGSQTAIFNEKLISISDKYKETYPNKIEREDYIINRRKVSLSPLLGTKRIIVYIYEQR